MLQEIFFCDLFGYDYNKGEYVRSNVFYKLNRNNIFVSVVNPQTQYYAEEIFDKEVLTGTVELLYESAMAVNIRYGHIPRNKVIVWKFSDAEKARRQAEVDDAIRRAQDAAKMAKIQEETTWSPFPTEGTTVSPAATTEDLSEAALEKVMIEMLNMPLGFKPPMVILDDIQQEFVPEPGAV